MQTCLHGEQQQFPACFTCNPTQDPCLELPACGLAHNMLRQRRAGIAQCSSSSASMRLLQQKQQS